MIRRHGKSRRQCFLSHLRLGLSIVLSRQCGFASRDSFCDSFSLSTGNSNISHDMFLDQCLHLAFKTWLFPHHGDKQEVSSGISHRRAGVVSETSGIDSEAMAKKIVLPGGLLKSKLAMVIARICRPKATAFVVQLSFVSASAPADKLQMRLARSGKWSTASQHSRKRAAGVPWCEELR